MARTTIQLDSTDLNSGNYKTQTIQHDSGAPVDINNLRLAREDGRKIISTVHDWKEITLTGTVDGTSQSDMETNLDTLKKTLNVTNGNLDVTYAGDTRRYKVALSTFTSRRDHYNITIADWSCTFVAHKGVGEDTAVTEALSAVAMDDTTTTWEDINFGGTATPKPVVYYVIDTAGNLEDITLTNDTTGTQITVGTAWADGDLVEIDTENKDVLRNDADMFFNGVFPDFQLGDNDLRLDMTVSQSVDIEMTTADWFEYFPYWTNKKYAQSIDPDTTTNYESVAVIISKFGSPVNDVTMRLETDNAGEPSGTLVTANSHGTIANADISSNPTWITVPFQADVALTAGTTYWIVLSGTDIGSFDYFRWWRSNASEYADGEMFVYASGSWSAVGGKDATFRLYKSTTPTYSVDMSIDYPKRYL